MRFAVKSLSAADFAKWVGATKAGGGTLDRAAYLKLEKPSEKGPARRFAAVEPQLFDAIVNMCVAPGNMGMHDMMSIDRSGEQTSEIQSLMRISYAVFCSQTTKIQQLTT